MPTEAEKSTQRFEETFSIDINGILTSNSMSQSFEVQSSTTIDLTKTQVFSITRIDSDPVEMIRAWALEAKEKWTADQKADIENEKRKIKN